MNDPGFEYVANISLLFAELPYDERAAAAKAAGFDRVETWWPFAGPAPAVDDIDAFVAGLDRAGVALSGLNFYAGDMAAGDRGIASHPDRSGELEANAAVVAQIAERTGCRMFNLLYGQRDERWSEQEQADAASRAIVLAADAVAPSGGTVLIEPLAEGLNGAYPLHTPEDALAVLAAAESTAGRAVNAGFLFDTFHLGSNGVDIVEAARRFAGSVAHVQLADAPGRGEPGSGGLDIEAALAALHDGGYRGLVAAEYKPTVATVDSLGWLVR